MYSLPANQNYSQATGTSSTNPFVEVFFPRDPTVNDVNYTIQKRWFNTVGKTEWILLGFNVVNLELQANWVLIANSNSMLGFDGGSGTTGFPVLADPINKRVTLTSTDGSVVITGDETTHAIDFKVSASGGFEWTVVTDPFAMEAGKGYILNAASYGTVLTGTLPSSAIVGDTFKILEISGATLIQLQAGQTLALGRDTSSVAGTVYSNFIIPSPIYATEGASIEIICISLGDGVITFPSFRAFNWVGNWTLT